jgi:hypothetical protein
LLGELEFKYIKNNDQKSVINLRQAELPRLNESSTNCVPADGVYQNSNLNVFFEKVLKFMQDEQNAA